MTRGLRRPVRGDEVMAREEVAVFVSLYRGRLYEVYVFRDRKQGEEYYKNRVTEEYGSEEEYQKALEHEVNTEYHLHHVDMM